MVIDDSSFDPNILYTKHKHVQVKKKRTCNDLVSKSISSSIASTRRKSTQSADRDATSEKEKRI